jgi:hypothetical protein
MLVKTMSLEINPQQDEQKTCLACKKLKPIKILINDLCPDCYKLSEKDLPNEKL